MTTVKSAPRHRKARRPITPLSDLASTLSSANLSPVRGTAVASVTGIALTAAVSAVANAVPAPLVDAAQPAPTTRVSDLPTTVSVPDISWAADSDFVELAATAEAPEPEVVEVEEPEPEVVDDQSTTDAASRSETRADLATATTTAAAVPAAAASGSSVVSIAYSLLGIPYVYAGSSPGGFDCSGFTQYVYAQAGISIPRTSGEQTAAGTIIPASEAQPGDLLSWGYHVAIYIGDGMMIDASTPGTVTSVRSIWGSPQYVRF